jgi:NTP pyrophosphatase (non-canonical NTP hydrolase)
MYPVTSLMIEAAEAADLFVKPLLRGDDVEIDKVKVVSELGDVLWNLANMAADQGLKLEDIAIFNVEKLKSRQARGAYMGVVEIVKATYALPEQLIRRIKVGYIY